jgi:hypothetical protein
MVEAMGRSIKQALENGALKGITLNQHVDPLSRLQFVDNNLLMEAPIVREANSFKGILETFLASGAQVNRGKSFIYFFNSTLGKNSLPN